MLLLFILGPFFSFANNPNLCGPGTTKPCPGAPPFSPPPPYNPPTPVQPGDLLRFSPVK